MKFKHSVIFNKKLYRAGMEVPMPESSETTEETKKLRTKKTTRKKKAQAEEAQTEETKTQTDSAGADVNDN
ncbi:MAG: hypothetical protein LUD81_10565 [Clostridiales bacterium]|nr:hypothetical protein [Clostridiales bacterium]